MSRKTRLFVRATPEQSKAGRRFEVEYELAYDGGMATYSCHYRTERWAKIDAWIKVHITSWGGTADLIDHLYDPAPPIPGSK